MTTWDILTTSIPHRHARLLSLLETLDAQMDASVRMILYRDNLEVPYGDKTRALVEASDADYVSCIDDDDSVAPDFIPQVLRALKKQPDYVGFRVRWTRDGQRQWPVEHNLEFGCWEDRPQLLCRDIAQFNPIRRELALPEAWAGGWRADRDWSDAVRATGRVKTQVFIPAEMYYYQNTSYDHFQMARKPWDQPVPELPSYLWLRQIGPYA